MNKRIATGAFLHETSTFAATRAEYADFDRRSGVGPILHGNVTPQMVAPADVLDSYRTCPHVDLAETGADPRGPHRHRQAATHGVPTGPRSDRNLVAIDLDATGARALRGVGNPGAERRVARFQHGTSCRRIPRRVPDRRPVFRSRPLLWRAGDGDGPPSACLRRGALRLAPTSRKAQRVDGEMLRTLGIVPEDQRLWVVKSSNPLRADFEPIAQAILVCAAPGPMADDPATLPWTRLRNGLRLHPHGPIFGA